MGQMANAITVITSFLLGHYIVEQEHQGQEHAKYGSKIIDSMFAYLTKEYGRGFSRSNVAGMRQFYMAYKDRENEIIQSQIGQFLSRNKDDVLRLANEGQYHKSQRIFYIHLMLLSLLDLNFLKAFQSVHYFPYVLCYNVLYDFTIEIGRQIYVINLWGRMLRRM